MLKKLNHNKILNVISNERISNNSIIKSIPKLEIIKILLLNSEQMNLYEGVFLKSNKY